MVYPCVGLLKKELSGGMLNLLFEWRIVDSVLVQHGVCFWLDLTGFPQAAVQAPASKQIHRFRRCGKSFYDISLQH